MRNETRERIAPIITNEWKPTEMQGQGVFLIGNEKIPVYSKSPAIWAGVFRELGIKAEYKAIGILTSEDVHNALRMLSTDPDFRGSNVGKPHKEAAYDYVKANGRVDDFADKVGAINTIVNEDGVLVGHNTDGEGFMKNIRPHVSNFAEQNILVIGAGGGTQGVLPALLEEGVTKVTLVNRTRERAEKLRERMMRFYKNAQIEIIEEEDIINVAKGGNFTMILNTSGKGQALVVDEEGYSSLTSTTITREESEQRTREALAEIYRKNPNILCADIIYNPVRSPFLKIAEETGFKVVNGKMMLVHQAALAFQLIFKDKVNVPYERLVEIMEKEFDKASRA